MASGIPREIIEHIIDLIWDEPDDADFYFNYSIEYRTLAAFSLSCTILRPRCQRHLFRTVTLLNIKHLTSFAAVVSEAPQLGKLVKTLVVLATYAAPNAATSFAPILARHLPALHTLHIRTEVVTVEEVSTPPPLFSLHPTALHTFNPHFKTVKSLSLFGLRFRCSGDLFKLLSACRGLEILQCMELLFDEITPLRGDAPSMPFMSLTSLDVAFLPHVIMCTLFRRINSDSTEYPKALQHLTISAPEVLSKDAIAESMEEHPEGVRIFHELESFKFFVPVKADGASYEDLFGYLAFLNRKVSSIILSHYLPGNLRDHVVSKRKMIDSIQFHSSDLERGLDPTRFSNVTQVVFQFQGFQDSESEWKAHLRQLLPNLHKREGYITVQNITYSDWSPWLEDKDRSSVV